MQGRKLLCSVHCDTCGLYPSQKIVQLGRNQDWFVTVLASELLSTLFSGVIRLVVIELLDWKGQLKTVVEEVLY